MVYLSQIVEWKPAEKNIRKKLNYAENSKHNPVHEPFCIIVFVCRFYCFYTAMKIKVVLILATMQLAK